MGDRTRGIYPKFIVSRTDGSSDPGGKHENCFYFVLDCNHDPYARRALKEYAKACAQEYPKLANDIDIILMSYEFGQEPPADG